MASYLVTGSSRGIGLELVKQLAQLPVSQVSKVFAVTRTPSAAVKDLTSDGRVVNIVTDLNNAASLKTAAQEVEKALNGAGLDVLVNNAGISSLNPGGIENVPAEDLTKVYEVNVVAVHLVTGAFMPLLERGQKKVINVSSTLGSIGWSKTWGTIAMAYRASKAALNMMTNLYAQEYQDRGWTFLVVSPGWVKTDLGSQNADLEPEVAVKALVKLILAADTTWNGQYRNIEVPDFHIKEGPLAYTGQKVPW